MNSILRNHANRASLAIACATALLGCGEAGAQPNPAELQPYRPEIKATGMIKVYGDPLKGTMSALEEGFQKFSPEVRFASTPIGSECGFAGLYTGCGDLAPIVDPPTRDNYMAFFETFRYVPTEIVIASGSLGALPPATILVNAANPISHLTMSQLDRIFSAERIGTWRPLIFTGDFARGPETNLRTWGQLGLTGEWADKEIQTYGFATRTGEASYFEERVFHGSTIWNGNYREYFPGAQVDRMLEELSRDRYGIAWAAIRHADAHPRLKLLAIADGDADPYLAPTVGNVRDRLYPLTRDVSIYFKRPADGSVDPNVTEFLRFVLSREGQQIIANAGEYYPLTIGKLREASAKLQ